MFNAIDKAIRMCYMHYEGHFKHRMRLMQFLIALSRRVLKINAIKRPILTVKIRV